MKKQKLTPLGRARHFLANHRWLRRIVYATTSLATILLIIGFLNVFVFLPVKDPHYGVSFSLKRTQELGVDWKANFTALLDDMRLQRFRLMSYWDLGEPTRGQFDFADLDWQMDQAAKRGAKVSLAIGLRQPRWPECHQPEWALQLQGNAWKQALYSYIEVVMKRYQHHPALESWQLENEGMNNWFGSCGEADRQRLVEEFALAKKIDPGHPIEMSLSDEHGLPFGQPVPDAYGFSIYRIVWNDKVPPHGYIVYPAPIWYHRLRAAIITLIHNKPIFIHELQMEPWGEVQTSLLSIEEQNKSMSRQQIDKMFDFARRTDIQDMDMWGGEWWYWRKVQGDPSIWNEVKQQIQTQR